MDEDEGELQIVEQENHEDLHLQVWDEEISDAQREAFEARQREYEKFKLLQKGLHERRICNGPVEYWIRRKAVTTNANKSIRAPAGLNTSFPIVISATNTVQEQSYPMGRISFSPATSVSVSTVYTRPQLSTVRASKPVEATASTLPQTVSVVRNTVQQGNVRTTNVVPVQQFSNLLFDTNSGLLIMPTAQPSMSTQPIAIRPRQPATVTPRPATSSTLVTTRVVTSSPATASAQLQQGVRTANKLPITPVVPTAKAIPGVQPKVTPVNNLKSPTSVLQPQSVSSLLQRVATNISKATSPAANGSVPTVRVTTTPTTTPNGVGSKELPRPSSSAAVSITKLSGATEKPSVNGVDKTGIVNGNSDPNNNAKTFPSLVVNVKPCLQEKPSRQEINSSRADLDQTVKTALVYAPSRFTEWLMQKGLLRLEHKCFLHKGEDGQPVQFKLGMYSDKDKEQFSGGYVWISDCCPGRQISVYEGSIFDSSHHPPTTLLKLIYHWACQTSATNVLNWCKVSPGYLRNFYTLLRSVCVAALHELCPKMGGQGKYIEVGIITLGTTLTGTTGKKQVKIEILGVFDPETKLIRMKLVNPQQSATSLQEASKSRGLQILSPLNIWVDKASTILFDGSIEQDLLLEMGFKHLTQCQNPSDKETDTKVPTNVNVMNYLKHVVPKMFQNTLCVLSKSLIQQFLDELSWREKWGITPSSAFDNILEHIKTMTNWEYGPDGSLLTWLNKISLNPFQDWSYSRSLQPSGIDLLPDSIRRGDAMPALSSQIADGKAGGANGAQASSPQRNASKPPVLLPQVPTLTLANGPVKRKPDTPTTMSSLMEYFLKQPKTISLESYYYAELPSVAMKDSSGEFPQNVKCPLCSKPFFSNTEVYRHIYSHVHAIGRAPATINFCNYCLKDIPTASLSSHVQECHKMTKGEGYACRICQERFTRESALVIHMWENHCEADTPYVCELCDYRSSFHYQVVDHYNQSHKGTDTVLCPICMKILSAKSHYCLKQITVHIQTHQMRKGKKCPHCCLLFFGDTEYRAHISEGAHKGKPSNSRKIIYYNSEEKGLLMAKPPPVSRPTLLQPPAKKPKTATVFEVTKKMPAVTTGSKVVSSSSENMYNIREHSVTMHGVGQRGCLECHTNIERPDHFPGYMSCIKCRFSTCCKSAMQLHHATAHPTNGSGRKSSSMRVKNTEMLENPLLCACGFETVNPNRLARHLALCDKITAYPLDWEEQQKKRAGQPPPKTLTAVDHLQMMRENTRT